MRPLVKGMLQKVKFVVANNIVTICGRTTVFPLIHKELEATKKILDRKGFESIKYEILSSILKFICIKNVIGRDPYLNI